MIIEALTDNKDQSVVISLVSDLECHQILIYRSLAEKIVFRDMIFGNCFFTVIESFRPKEPIKCSLIAHAFTDHLMGSSSK